MALNRPDRSRCHLNYPGENGLKKEKLVEAIAHLAFYSGWPNAMRTIMIRKELFSKP